MSAKLADIKWKRSVFAVVSFPDWNGATADKQHVEMVDSFALAFRICAALHKRRDLHSSHVDLA